VKHPYHTVTTGSRVDYRRMLHSAHLFYGGIPMTRIQSRAIRLSGLSLALALSWPLSAAAGVSYSLDTNHASAGETVRVQALVFNDTPNQMDWEAPETIVLQWRSERGQALR